MSWGAFGWPVYLLWSEIGSVSTYVRNLPLICYVGVGKRGDEVQVRPQYGYEKLLLPGLAEYYSEEAKERLAASTDSTNEPEYSSPYVERVNYSLFL
jgi:signal peptidase I